MANGGVRTSKIMLPDEVIKDVARKLGIDDESRIPSSIEFHVIDASDALKKATKGTAAPFGSLRTVVVP